MTLKLMVCKMLFLLLLEIANARDLCNTPIDKRTTPKECTVGPALQKWVDFSKEQQELGVTLIRGQTDPLACVPTPNGDLSTVWERTGTSPFNMLTFYVIAFPIFCGIVSLQIARIFKLEIKQDTSRDKWGFRVKTYPILPVSMLQESDKDKEFKRVKRNTVGWYCHKWFFHANDIIREIAMEDEPHSTSNNPWEKIRFLGRLHTLFRKTAKQKHQWDSTKKKIPDVKNLRVDHDFQKLFPTVKLEKKIELQIRQPQLKKLWVKLQEWIQEQPERDIKRQMLLKEKERLRKQKKGHVNEVESDSSSSWGDSDDSYWGSSESYSSDHSAGINTEISE